MINTILSATAFGYTVGPILLLALALTLVAGIYFGAEAAINRFSSTAEVNDEAGSTPVNTEELSNDNGDTLIPSTPSSKGDVESESTIGSNLQA